MRFLLILPFLLLSLQCGVTTTVSSTITAVNSFLAAGQQHTCVIMDNSSVSCWGLNNTAELGNGGYKTTATGLLLPSDNTSLPAGRTATVVDASNVHSCAILDNGSVSCWGLNGNGQLGNGGYVDASGYLLLPSDNITLPSGRTAVAITTGREHSCVILDNASVSCWGLNGNGQLGNGDDTNLLLPSDNTTLPTGRTAATS